MFYNIWHRLPRCLLTGFIPNYWAVNSSGEGPFSTLKERMVDILSASLKQNELSREGRNFSQAGWGKLLTECPGMWCPHGAAVTWVLRNYGGSYWVNGKEATYLASTNERLGCNPTSVGNHSYSNMTGRPLGPSSFHILRPFFPTLFFLFVWEAPSILKRQSITGADLFGGVIPGSPAHLCGFCIENQCLFIDNYKIWDFTKEPLKKYGCC